jgi:hypothetical protein
MEKAYIIKDLPKSVLQTTADQLLAISFDENSIDINSRLGTETNDRQNADAVLDVKITTEVTNRTNANTTEATNRNNADVILQADINTKALQFTLTVRVNIDSLKKLN